MQIVNPLLPLYTFPIPINLKEWKDITKGKYTDMNRDTPTRVQISESKTFNTQRTLSGWVTSHWGENIPTMDCSGNIILLPGQEALATLSLFILRSLYRLDKQNIEHVASSVLGKITSTVTIGGVAANNIFKGEFSNFDLNKGIDLAMSAYSLGAYINRLKNIKATGLAPTYIYHDNNIYQGYFTNFTYTKDINNARLINYNFKLNIEWNSQDAFIDIWKNKDTLSIASITGI